MRLARLELIITRGDNVLDAFQLDGKTDAQGGAWLDGKLRLLGLKQAGDVRLRTSFPITRSATAPTSCACSAASWGSWRVGSAARPTCWEEFRSKLSGVRGQRGGVLAAPFRHRDPGQLEEGPPANARSIGVARPPETIYYAQPYFYIAPGRASTEKAARSARAGTLAHRGLLRRGAHRRRGSRDEGPRRGLMGFITAAFDIGRTRLGARS